MELQSAERVARAFEAKYEGIKVRVERSGAERNYQRIGQEYASGVRAVDVVNSSDAAHFISWKRDGLLAPYSPRTWPNITHLNTGMQTACSPPSASS